MKRLVAVNADVRRDGTTVSLPVAVLVPGDVVELKAGDSCQRTVLFWCLRVRTLTRPC